VISKIPVKIPKNVVVLMSAAILLQAYNVQAAEMVGDAQMQARDLLSGTVNGKARTTVDPSPAIPAGAHRTPNLDPQEQARRLTLGKPYVRGGARLRVAIDSKKRVTPGASARAEGRGYSDPQELAQRMILGSRT
jgi:hypothetical protein